MRRTKRSSVYKLFVILATIAFLIALWTFSVLQPRDVAAETQTYLGCDLNQYPGDEAMRQLHQDCKFTGYWLSPPPEEKTSSWRGKREFLHKLGYGFLPLYLGPLDAKLKSTELAQQQGKQDGIAAARAAAREGFVLGVIVFLDVEEGGRLSANYHAYLRSWAAAIHEGGFRPGAYCSGMPVSEGKGVTINTAEDIRNDSATKNFSFWVFNDQCPPSRGCEPLTNPAQPSASGIAFAAVWQFTRSPRQKQYTAHCPVKYAADGNCYAPSDSAHKWFLDLNSALTPDPSAAGL